MASPPAPPSVPAAKSRCYERKCVVLVEWWLEKMDGKIYIAGVVETPQMRKGGFSSQGNQKSAARLFKCVIATVRDPITVETVNGYVVRIKGNLNKSRMRDNGFSEQVCESFMCCGFQIQWKKLLDSNMEHIDEDPESPSNASDDALEEYYMKKFMSDSFVSKGYSFAQNSFSSFGNVASSDLGEPGTPKCRKTSVNLGAEGFSFAQNSFSSFGNLAPSDLGEPGTPKCCKTSVNLGAESASEVPAAGIIPPSGAVQASEKNEVRTLRSGRVLGGSVPMTGRNKRKRSQHEASNKKLPNDAVSPTVDMTSCENSRSAAGILAEDKLQSHDSHSKGRRNPAKKTRAKLESKKLFSNFV